jgi:hypothetical protein
MTKGQILASYKHMSPADQRTFKRWLAANAVISSMFAAVLFAMALAGSNSSGPQQANSQDARYSEITAGQRPGPQNPTR